MAGENVRAGERELPRHPMGVVVQRTGLTAHVLRAWERRYGAVTPGRTEGGQRLYSDADVVRLRLLKRATEQGRPIGTVATRPTAELIALVGAERPGRELWRRPGTAADAGGWAGSGGSVGASLRRCLEAADRMDRRTLRSELMQAVVGLGAHGFVTGVVAPLLERVGELWEAGDLRPAQEHVVSTAVRQVLDWLLGRYDPPGEAPLLVAGTPAGELHEFGALLAAVVAADAGWRVLYLGPSLPSDEIAAAAQRAGAGVVAVSVVDGEEGEGGRAGEELAALRALLPEWVLLVAGGRRASAVTPEGVLRVGNLDVFREVLRAAAPARSDAEAEE